jgi:hypothetical protein
MVGAEGRVLLPLLLLFAIGAWWALRKPHGFRIFFRGALSGAAALALYAAIVIAIVARLMQPPQPPPGAAGYTWSSPWIPVTSILAGGLLIFIATYYLVCRKAS